MAVTCCQPKWWLPRRDGVVPAYGETDSALAKGDQELREEHGAEERRRPLAMQWMTVAVEGRCKDTEFDDAEGETFRCRLLKHGRKVKYMSVT